MGALPDVKERLSALNGVGCWDVAAGGSAGSRFLLDLGGMRRLPRPVSISPRTKYVEIYEGEFILFVRSSWRLDGPSRHICSSDVPAESIGKDLRILIGKTILSIEVTSPAWDLRIAFSDDLSLTVFCDYVAGDENEHNRHVVLREEWLFAGPGYEMRTEPRD
jgi:hypothetical protein